jgi:hypothetical protein
MSMTRTIRAMNTIHAMSKLAGELGQLARAFESLGATAQSLSPVLAELAQQAAPAVKGRIERLPHA